MMYMTIYIMYVGLIKSIVQEPWQIDQSKQIDLEY